MKHSRAPWTIVGPVREDGGDNYAITTDGKIIAECYGKVAIDTYSPSYRNARLIAAAPDLLAAATNCIADLEHYVRTHGHGPDERLEALQAAINKATED